MSRSYSVDIKATNVTRCDLEEVLNDLGYCFIGTYSDHGMTAIDEVDANLGGGKSEKQAHEEIEAALVEINPNAKVKTRWTKLVDLPYNEYGNLE